MTKVTIDIPKVEYEWLRKHPSIDLNEMIPLMLKKMRHVEWQNKIKAFEGAKGTEDDRVVRLRF